MKLRPKDIRRAEGIKYLSPIPPTGNPEQDLRTATESILSKGWNIVERTPGSAFDDWTTTFHRRIATEAGFSNLPVWQQQATLWHEDVHINQRDDMGRHRFNARYIGSPRWRWVLEMHAYRESVRNLKARGATDREIEIYVDRVYWVLRYRYQLRWFLNARQMKKETRRILMLGATDWD